VEFIIGYQLIFKKCIDIYAKFWTLMIMWYFFLQVVITAGLFSALTLVTITAYARKKGLIGS